MPFRIVATILAEGVSLDRLTNRLTAFNMLESVMAPSFPAALAKLAVVNIYEIDGDRVPHVERVSILSPEDDVLAQTSSKLEGEVIAHRTMHLFQGVRLAKPATYRVLVEGARTVAGPWEKMAQRWLVAVESPHPLVAGKAEARDVAALTD